MIKRFIYLNKETLLVKYPLNPPLMQTKLQTKTMPLEILVEQTVENG